MTRSSLILSSALLASTSMAMAAEVQPGLPLLVYNSQGMINYDSSTDVFSVVATPLVLRFAAGQPPRAVNPVPGATRYVEVRIQVSDTGELIGGHPTRNDLEVFGEVDSDGDGDVDFSGLLLTGEITNFCFRDNPAPSIQISDRSRTFARPNPNTVIGVIGDLSGMESGETSGNELGIDEYDLCFRLTGGELAGLYGSNDIGMTILSEDSSFAGDFTVDFFGGAKGNIGPIDPKGACCLSDGSCSDQLTEAQCDEAGGAWKGPQTDCGPDTCTGACCLDTSACTESSLAECEAAGGEYQGDGTACDTTNCPDPEGACCLDNGSCLNATEMECDDAGKTYQGDGTDCATHECPQPGACCLASGACVQALVVDGPDCAGDYQGNDTDCDMVDCPDPEGACCLDSGGCLIATEQECDDAGKIYQGDLTDCSMDLCDQPGACCLADGSCVQGIVVGGADCNGDYQGNDTTCADVSCDAPGGACCLSDGSCVQSGMLGGADCAGDYQGDNTSCATTECPQPGACCLSDGSCVQSTMVGGMDCGGSYQGDGTSCDTTTCDQPGACCLSDGSCVTSMFLGGADCNGMYQGDNTNCADVSCDGACCLTDGSCVITDGEGCAAGDYQGLGSDCATSSCPQPGACCLSDGTCVQSMSVGGADCAGAYQSDGTSCDTARCDGACCLSNGDCLETDAAGCADAGGIYQGLGTSCTAANCDQPGACCLADGSCTQSNVLGGADCNGDYQGDNTSCADVNCNRPGACCLDDGSCVLAGSLGGSDCAGLYQGDNTECAGVSCPQPGACCLEDGSCVQSGVLGGADCIGAYQGDNTDCDAANCPQPGACCLSDGSCVQAAALGGADCVGSYQGDGTDCADVMCPQPGACCLEDGSCVQAGTLGGSDCDGTYQGDGTNCADVVCDAPGACCLPPVPAFTCSGDVTGISMVWDGVLAVRVIAWAGSVGSTMLADVDNVVPGDTVTVDGYGGSPNDVFWQIFLAGTSDEIGQSKFHLSCSDNEMNGDEDCGARQGNGKNNESNFVNDWLLAGIVTTDEVLDCGAFSSDDGCLSLLEDECIAAGGAFQGDGTVCADADCFGEDCCVDGRPVGITVEYTGDVCPGTNSQGSNSECTDFGSLPASVFIIANEKDDPTSGVRWFDGTVTLGGRFLIDARAVGQTELKTNVWIHIYDSEGGNLLQRISIHTSCSKPLITGETFGAVQLVACGEDPQGACCLSDYSCVETDALDCVGSLSGAYQGDFTVCSDVDCTPPPVGACCLDGNSCVETDEWDCVENLYGTYQGDTSLCGDVDCSTPCEGDLTEGFENGDAGWDCINATSCGVEDGAGNPGDSYGACDSNGISGAVAGPKFSGDLSAYDGGQVCVDLLFFDDVPVDAETGQLEIVTGSGTFVTDFVPQYSPVAYDYRTFCGDLTASAFGVSQATWEAGLADVQSVLLLVEPDWTCWCIDNFKFTCP